MTRPVGALAGLFGFAVLALVATSAIVLLPFTSRPRPHRTAGILFGPGFDGRLSLGAIAASDPKVRLVDMRWRGRLVFVVYDAADFPDAVRRSGALYLFDAISAGCHTPDKVL